MLVYVLQEPHASNALVQGIVLHAACIMIEGNLCARQDDLREISPSLLFWNNSFSCPSGSWLILWVIYCWKLRSCLYVNRLLFAILSLCARICLTLCLSSIINLSLFSRVMHGGSLNQLGLSVATGFSYHLKALCCKREHLLAKYTLHVPIDAFKVGSHSVVFGIL